MRMRSGMFKRIETETVQEVVGRNFAATYLTILGIILSVVLGMLINKFYNVVTNGVISPFALASGFLTLLNIVLVWHAYQWYPYLDRWPPRLADSVIPFFLGVSQGACALSIDHGSNFFAALTLTGIAGFAAYTNTRANLHADDFTLKEVYDLHMVHLKVSQGFTALGVLYTFAVLLTVGDGEMSWAWLLGAYLVGLALFWSSTHFWGEILRELGFAYKQKS